MNSLLSALWQFGLPLGVIGLFFFAVWRVRPSASAPKVPRDKSDTTLYAVIADGTGPPLSAWPTPGTAGELPPRGRLCTISELVEAPTTQLWVTEREGKDLRLIRRLEHFDGLAVLSWAADCVEHLAQTIAAIPFRVSLGHAMAEAPERVSECVAFARRHATTRSYDAAAADRCTAAVQQTLRTLAGGGVAAVDKADADAASSPPILPLAANRQAETDRRIVGETAASLEVVLQVATFEKLLQAALHLTQADGLEAAQLAPAQCRKAVTGMRGGIPRAEAIWQRGRLREYLQAPASQQQLAA